MYFPKWFGQDQNTFEALKQYAILKIDVLLNPEDDEIQKQLFEIANYFIEMNKPLVFNPNNKDNAVIKNEKRFLSVLNSMQEVGLKTENLSTFEFYNKIDYLETKYKNKPKNGSNK